MNNTATMSIANHKAASAKLMGHARRVSLAELAKLQAPPSTKTYNPVSHITVVDAIREQVEEYGWSFVNPQNPFEVSVTEQKMFGVTSVITKGVDREDFNMAIGFRHSYNKTMALKIAIGEHVTVCDNMCMHGDVMFRREQTARFDINIEASRAFEALDERVASMIDFNMKTRKVKMDKKDAVYFLFRAVKEGALPETRLVEAIKHYEHVLDGEDKDIFFANSLWGAKQAVTHELRDMSPQALYGRSACLQRLVTEYVA